MPRTENLEGRLRISRPSGGRHDEGEVIRICLTDESSGIAFVEVEIGLAEMMRALTSAEDRCRFTLRWTDNVGCRREVKTVSVYVPRVGYDREAMRKAAIVACAPYEEDGWRAHYDDALNHHRRTGGDDAGDTYGVTFVRFVDPDEAPTATANTEPF